MKKLIFTIFIYDIIPTRWILFLLIAGHPVVLCTDDPSEGIFDTKLSKEYAIAAQTFNLSKQQLLDLAFGAVDAAFLSPLEEKSLKERMKRHLAEQQFIEANKI